MKPKNLNEFCGQENVKKLLHPAIEAAKKGKKLAHILLLGPAGTGKTTLAELVAQELGRKCTIVDAGNVKSQQDFIDLALGLDDGDFLFIDELHGLAIDVEEMLYEAVLKFQIRTKVGDKMITIPLPEFTLVGASTKPSQITHPMRTRFGIVAELEYYTVEELSKMVMSKCIQSEMFISRESATSIAKASRGTARILENILDYCANLAVVQDTCNLTRSMVTESLNRLGIDEFGLNETDRKLMKAMRDTFKNQPTGLKSLAATLGTDMATVEDVVEPHLLRSGFLIRTSRGRVLSERGLGVLR